MTTLDSMIHIFYSGESTDIPYGELDLAYDATDAQIKQAVADWLEAPISKISNFVLERNQTSGDITLRPQAVFGNLS